MSTLFGLSHKGEQTHLYTIQNETLTAKLTDFGATLVQLWVPDSSGNVEDVVLGYEEAMGYVTNDCYFGATVGRNCNRIKNGRFLLNGQVIQLATHNNGNSLHSMPNGFNHRVWKVDAHTESSITFSLHSPHGDQGFPGNADVSVTYALEDSSLVITFRGISDQDTVFNLTNHSAFNMAGHQNTHLAMKQILTLPGEIFTPADEVSITTGEEWPVEGTPMDFRFGKPIGQDIDADYTPLHFQSGYDHNFAVKDGIAAILQDPVSGRRMTIKTDCPGVHFYSGNYMDNFLGKNGAVYVKRAGLCLETQFYPDAVNKPHWVQPITKANTPYFSQTKFIFD
ncbi:MAG: galactose mutarotase [Oscillospiraceae bacterium]|nr:galactose mutarotase [Oscillospiraceae bacterium]